MQALILFIGAMVFVLSLFAPSPVIFQPGQAKLAAQAPGWKDTEDRYNRAFERRRESAFALAAAARHPQTGLQANLAGFRNAEDEFTQVRKTALGKFDDTNYIFLSFVLAYLPAGLVGLSIGVIFSASMGSTSGEINSLATVSVIDLYKRYVVRNGSDHHYLTASRVLTVFWGAFAVAFASFGAHGFGALIERVNIVGSLFYGGLLGVFVLAFGFPHVRGTAAFLGVLVGEAAIFAVAAFTSTSFLWYNVVGCAVVVFVGLAVESISGAPGSGTT
jgi:hypothetical protein